MTVIRELQATGSVVAVLVAGSVRMSSAKAVCASLLPLRVAHPAFTSLTIFTTCIEIPCVYVTRSSSSCVYTSAVRLSTLECLTFAAHFLGAKRKSL